MAKYRISGWSFLWPCGATPCGAFRLADSFLLRSEGLVHVEAAPQASWLREVEAYLKDVGMTVLASAWTMARQRPRKYRRKVDAVTRCSDVRPHT